MEAKGDHIRRYNYTGDRRVPHDVTHVIIDASVTVIRRDAFHGNRNIVEVICDVNVKKVEGGAFRFCPCLRRVIMPGVEVVERLAFDHCLALTDVEFRKLEIVKARAFKFCKSLGSIDLPSARIVEGSAFEGCTALTEAKFGSELERIEMLAFVNCRSLERITIPLKDGLITHDNTFTGCNNFKHVDLVEGAIHATIAALQLEEWRNDIYGEINSINQILPTVSAGIISIWRECENEGEKARAIRTWIRSVLRKIVHYQLQLALPQDIVMNNVLPFAFVDLPSYTFEVEDYEEGEEQEYLDGEEEDDEE